MSIPSRSPAQRLFCRSRGNTHWHIYYGQYFVGIINRSYGGWCAWHLGLLLEEFADLDAAKQAAAG